jgi:hypothetical protein
MSKILSLLLIMFVSIGCAPINTQTNKLPKYKKKFFDKHLDIAWYVYVKYDVPPTITLSAMAIETNYGRKKRMMKRGDLFGTGKTYKHTQAWDEFGKGMKQNYFKMGSIKMKKVMSIKNEIRQQ